MICYWQRSCLFYDIGLGDSDILVGRYVGMIPLYLTWKDIMWNSVSHGLSLGPICAVEGRE